MDMEIFVAEDWDGNPAALNKCDIAVPTIPFPLEGQDDRLGHVPGEYTIALEHDGVHVTVACVVPEGTRVPPVRVALPTRNIVLWPEGLDDA